MSPQGPWDWFRDHTVVEPNHVNSGYDVGIDTGGDLLIHHEGHVATIDLKTLVGIVERGYPMEDQ